jgi:hypothetical protein
MVDFFTDAITPSCQRGIIFLASQAFIKDFYLAGGTALALQLGHRISTDLDWFSASRNLLLPEREAIQSVLSTGGKVEIVAEQDGVLYANLFEMDVSFVYQHHPLIESTIEYQGIQLASPIDIGLMKLAAINSRGTRRDFIDLYCLREIVSLNRLLELAPQKYKDRSSFLAITARALAYFDDAETQPIPRMLIPIRWEDVRTYCEAAARKLTRRMSGLET